MPQGLDSVISCGCSCLAVKLLGGRSSCNNVALCVQAAICLCGDSIVCVGTEMLVQGNTVCITNTSFTSCVNCELLLFDFISNMTLLCLHLQECLSKAEEGS